ncbi:MAG TPA: RagB/SusD family nutrient uptake outer membrane protein [Chitinophagaceae bacterium]
MKKVLYTSGCLALLALGACNKDLTQVPPSSTTTANFYGNTNDFTQAVTGAYSKLRNYPDAALWMGEVRSDNVVIATDGNRDFQGINDFSPNLTNTSFVVTEWDNDFSGIFNTNTVLDKLVTNGTNIADTSLRRRFGAECHFLRAFYYFNLLRFYGKLPIVTSALTPPQVAAIPRSEVKDVYTLIISDLQYAAANLPGAYSGADVGRATSWAAKGVLGLVYLTRSGPTYGLTSGPGLASGEYDLARAQFDDIINNGGFVFSTDYPSIFSYTNENNKEVLFDIQYISTTNGGDFPSQIVPASYWTGLGLSGYDNAYGTSSYNVTKNLLASFKNSAGPGVTDKRDTFSIKHAFLQTTTATVPDTINPFEKKYINPALRGASRSDWPINFIVMRYTDVLLMKAEAILRGASGTQSYVDSVVNKVRTRAGIATVSNVTIPMLMEERRREFIAEGLRWNDLVREGMAVTTMNAWIASDTIPTIRAIIPQYIIYPVPEAEILTKPGLYTQNDGYY